MKNNYPLTTARAVVYGHVFVTLPVLMIIAITTAITFFLIGPPSGDDGELALRLLHIARLPFGAIVGTALSWLWWSVGIPRWRDWARAHGADDEETQRIAQRTLLLW